MDLFQNLDLFSVGVAIAATATLGFVILFNNYKSNTNRAFFSFAVITTLWGIANYLQYQLFSACFTDTATGARYENSSHRYFIPNSVFSF